MVFSREYPHSFGEALRVCREILSGNRDLVRDGLIETEAERLVIGAHRIATGQALSRVKFFTMLQDRFPEATADKLLVLAGQRAEGIPLQYLLGWQDFLEHEYEVNSSVLIPRPETEMLVCTAVAALKEPKLGLEIGLGSGVISIELLHAFPSLRMVATEISEGAIALARRNAERILGAEGALRLEIVKAAHASEPLEPLVGQGADFLVSNPPYLDSSAPAEVNQDVLAHEPGSALFPRNGDPLYFYRGIAAKGGELLTPGGRIFLEIAAERAEPTLALFEKSWKAKILPDLAGRPRLLVAEKG